MSQPYVLILYYSLHGATHKLAQLIARGVESCGELEARIRTVPPISHKSEQVEPVVPESGAVYCSYDDLKKLSWLSPR